MTEFKQIIGRGTRVRDDYGKLFFNILDYTGSATRLFADPDFDGDPVQVTEEQLDANGETIGEPILRHFFLFRLGTALLESLLHFPQFFAVFTVRVRAIW
jgi:hypothetical protein